MKTAVGAPAPKPSIDEIIAGMAALPVVEALDVRAEIQRLIFEGMRRLFEEDFPGWTLDAKGEPYCVEFGFRWVDGVLRVEPI